MSEIDLPQVELTAEEKQVLRDNAFNAFHPGSWIWKEEITNWVAPVDPPADGNPYLWNEERKEWEKFPGYPNN